MAMKLENESTVMRMAVPLLLEWFQTHARQLPWRVNQTPYRVWVSEIMLQQTRAAAVQPYYERFMKELPDVAALADVPETRLLKLWEGLGYYSRARNLQKAARIILSEYGGCFPDTYSEIRKLPGVGPYTAGAVASIAFGEAVPAVDGNVLRVVSRITASELDIAAPAVRESIRSLIKEIIPENAPGRFNEALMELGACVCVPNSAARCGDCPLKRICMAEGLGRQDELPVKKTNKARRIENKTILVIRDGSRCFIRKRAPKGLLAGMYELPCIDGRPERKEVLSYVEGFGLVPVRIQKLPEAVHIFSHVEWHMQGYLIQLGEAEPLGNQTAAPSGEIQEGNMKYVTNGEENGMILTEGSLIALKYPVPSAYKAYMKYLTCAPEGY